MSEEIDVFRVVSQRLESVHIPYMLTGSVAANFYAVPRMTRDVDIVIEIDQADTDRVYKLFQNDFYVDREAISSAVKHEGMFNLIHSGSIVRIDFIVRKQSPYRQTEFQRRRLVHLGDFSIWIVSPEDLIISKLIWAKESMSEMQLKDIRNLLFNLSSQLDDEYMSRWISELGLQIVFEAATTHG